MSQLGTLIRARITSAMNGTRGVDGPLPSILLGVLGGLALLLFIGESGAERLLRVPETLAMPDMGGREAVSGSSAVESAFWLSTLVVAFFAFRVMESLFRSSSIRAIELLPVRPAAIFGERLLNALFEAVALGTAASVIFVPLAWHGRPELSALCAFLLVGATLCTACVTIGTNAWFGANYGGASGLGDAYGGHGGAFIYAPAVSFAVSVGCCFMLQLAAREVLLDGAVTRAAQLSAGVAAGLALLTLAAGARDFVRHYHLVAAFFREADQIGYQSVLDYQASVWAEERGEKLVRGRSRLLLRRDLVQFRRAFAVSRSVTTIGAVVGVLAAWGLPSEVFGTWAVALLPTALVVALTKPFGRADSESLGGASDALLPVSPTEVTAARSGLALWETGRIVVPYAVAVAIVRTLQGGVIEGVVTAVCTLFVSGGVLAAARIARRSSRGPSPSFAALLALLTVGALLFSVVPVFENAVQ